MGDNIQTNTTGRLTTCLQKKIDKTTCLVEVHFSDTNAQSVEDKLKRVILHDLEHKKQGKSRKAMNMSLASSNGRVKGFTGCSRNNREVNYPAASSRGINLIAQQTAGGIDPRCIRQLSKSTGG